MAPLPTDLVYLSIGEALRGFADRSLSPVELLDATLGRIGAVNGRVNAFTHIFATEARQQAETAARAWATQSARPLEGIPVAVKDESSIAGQVTTNGSLLWKDNVATTTSPANQRLIDAGAIIIGRTATPEFSMEIVTRSRLWGVTRNPWNLALTPFGSSGGSAAAVAAGMAMAGTGSDIGGSLRLPAGICGLVGPKPSHGRVPEDIPFNLVTAASQGAMTRNVADAAIVHNILFGPHPDDAATLRDKPLLPIAYTETMKPARIAFSRDLGLGALDPAIAALFDDLLARLADDGIAIEDAGIALDERAPRHFKAMLDMEMAGAISLSELAKGREDLLGPAARRRLANARATTPADFAASRQYSAELYCQFGALFERVDLLLVPTVRRVDITADMDIDGDPALAREIEGPFDHNLAINLTYPFNLMNRLPIVAVPIGIAHGVTVGVQVIARSYDDVRAFEGALYLEQLLGRWFETAGRRPDLS